MREIVGTNAVRLEGFEDGKYHAKTTFYDDGALDQNQRIRNSDMLDKAKLGLHDGEDIRMAISCPSTLQWATFKRKHMDTYKMITSKDESQRVQGCRQLQILHPGWVVYDRL